MTALITDGQLFALVLILGPLVAWPLTAASIALGLGAISHPATDRRALRRMRGVS